jgi:hypothetical protein
MTALLDAARAALRSHMGTCRCGAWTTHRYFWPKEIAAGSSFNFTACETCAKAGMARLATPDRPVESMGIEPLPGAEALLAFEGAAAEHEAREAIEERRRRAADEIVGGLPPCHRCRVTATWGCLDLTGHPFKACDLHKETGGIDGDQPPRLLPYASAVREYLGAVSEQTEATDRERGRTHAAVLTSAKLLKLPVVPASPAPVCPRCKGQPGEESACPYASELGLVSDEPDDSPCGCCDDCRRECAEAV